MPTLLYLPPWTQSYSYNVQPSQRRTQEPGYKRQAKKSHRNVVTASVTRHLRLAELAYFEHFIRTVCNNGTLIFTDSYADGAGLTTGNVRIKGGSYSVATDLRTHIVTCELEVFR